MNKDNKVPDAAQDARAYVKRDPHDAEKSARKAQHGPRKSSFVSIDEIVAKGRTVVDRVRPLVDRAAAKLRSRFSK